MGNILKVDKLKLLHAIRGFASFYVVVYHSKFVLWCGGREYLQTHPKEGLSLLEKIILGFNMMSVAGLQMVIVFFVLSGFFIAYSFDKHQQTYKDFFVNRAIRIYVPYIGSMIVGAAILYFIGYFNPGIYHISINREFNIRLINAYHDFNFSNLIKNLIFLKDKEYIGFNIPYWSLLFEGLFYLIVPFWVTRPKFYFYFSFALFIIGILFNINSQYGNLCSFIFSYNIYFAVGQFLYHNLNRVTQWVASISYSKMILYLLCILLFGCTIIFDLYDRPIEYANITGGLFACSLIVLFLSFEFTDHPFLLLLKKLGEVSFSLYLIHMPILILVYAIINHYTHTPVFYGFVYPIGVAVALLLSFPFYWYIEAPSVRWISSLKKRAK